MEYIYKKTGELITNTGMMEKILKEVYSEDMYEARLTKNFKPINVGGKSYTYGAVYKAVDEDRFRTDYKNFVETMAKDFIVKGEPSPECADHFEMVDEGFNFTSAMKRMMYGETVWATSAGLGLSTVGSKPYYFRIICGELCFAYHSDDPKESWDAVACLLRHLDFTEEVWHTLPEVSEEE